MADETTGAATGQTTASDQQQSNSDTQQQNADTAAAQQPAGMTEADRNRIAAEARREADAKAKAEKKRADDAEAELQKYRAAEEQRRQEALSEEQRKEEARLAAERERDEAKAALTRAQADNIRLQLIGEKCPTLPAYYKRGIEGSTAEEIEASITAAQEAYHSDNADKLDMAGLETARDMTPEARLQQYGEVMGAKLNDFFKQAPQSVGSPSHAGAAAGATTQGRYAEQMAEAAKLPAGTQRENALVAALASKQ